MLLDQQPSIAGVEESLHIFEQRVRVIRERHFWRRKSLHPGQRLAAKNRGKVMLPGVDVKFDIRDGSGRDHGVKQTARGRTSSAGLRTVPRATSSAPTQRCHGPRFAKRWRSSRSDCAKAGSLSFPNSRIQTGPPKISYSPYYRHGASTRNVLFCLRFPPLPLVSPTGFEPYFGN